MIEKTLKKQAEELFYEKPTLYYDKKGLILEKTNKSRSNLAKKKKNIIALGLAFGKLQDLIEAESKIDNSKYIKTFIAKMDKLEREAKNEQGGLEQES